METDNSESEEESMPPVNRSIIPIEAQDQNQDSSTEISGSSESSDEAPADEPVNAKPTVKGSRKRVGAKPNADEIEDHRPPPVKRQAKVDENDNATKIPKKRQLFVDPMGNVTLSKKSLSDMVQAGMELLAPATQRNGVSYVALKKYLAQEHHYTPTTYTLLTKLVKNRLDEGLFQQTKGKGVIGSFKLASQAKEKPKKPSQTAKKVVPVKVAKAGSDKKVEASTSKKAAKSVKNKRKSVTLAPKNVKVNKKTGTAVTTPPVVTKAKGRGRPAKKTAKPKAVVQQPELSEESEPEPPKKAAATKTKPTVKQPESSQESEESEPEPPKKATNTKTKVASGRSQSVSKNSASATKVPRGKRTAAKSAEEESSTDEPPKRGRKPASAKPPALEKAKRGQRSKSETPVTSIAVAKPVAKKTSGKMAKAKK